MSEPQGEPIGESGAAAYMHMTLEAYRELTQGLRARPAVTPTSLPETEDAKEDDKQPFVRVPPPNFQQRQVVRAWNEGQSIRGSALAAHVSLDFARHAIRTYIDRT